jgi:hypothetical protein
MPHDHHEEQCCMIWVKAQRFPKCEGSSTWLQPHLRPLILGMPPHWDFTQSIKQMPPKTTERGIPSIGKPEIDVMKIHLDWELTAELRLGSGIGSRCWPCIKFKFERKKVHIAKLLHPTQHTKSARNAMESTIWIFTKRGKRSNL